MLAPGLTLLLYLKADPKYSYRTVGRRLALRLLNTKKKEIFACRPLTFGRLRHPAGSLNLPTFDLLDFSRLFRPFRLFRL